MKKPSCQGRLFRDVRWPSASAALFVWLKIFPLYRYAEPTILGSLFLSTQSIPYKYRKVNRSSKPHSPAESTDRAFTQATFPRPSPWTPSASQARYLPHPGKARSPATSPNRRDSTSTKPSPPREKGDCEAVEIVKVRENVK